MFMALSRRPARAGLGPPLLRLLRRGRDLLRRIGGVLLVFSYLIVPALAAIMLGTSIGARLFIGWAFGTTVSLVGMMTSAVLDLPTGATVVCAFGLLLLGLGVALKAIGYEAVRSRAVAIPGIQEHR